ncbi:unnamed protein product [Discula destructiva]
MSTLPQATLSCRSGEHTFKSTLTPTVHLYTDPAGNNVVVKYAPNEEAKTHREISDPSNASIIRLLDVGQTNNATSSWLVLEWANSGTLRDLLCHARADAGVTPCQIPAAFCFHVLASILDAIVTMQEDHGVQHIDLHPGNVVLHMAGPYPPLVKVIDFGKIVQLKEDEDEDEIPWGESLTSSVGPLMRALLAQWDVLEDAFLTAIRPLSVQRISIASLSRARASALVSAGAVSENVPQWLAGYFAERTGSCDGDVVNIDDVPGQGHQNRHGQDDDGTELDDLVFRFSVTFNPY